MKLIRVISKVMIICLTLMMLSACENHFMYQNNDADLHAIATNSLLGVSVYESDQILVLETDSFGRKLFAYEGFTCNGTSESGRILAILVSQKTTDSEAYFYDNVNYLYCETLNANEYKKLNEQQVKNCFTEKLITALKARNDWNMPLNENKFFRVKVESKKDTVSKDKIKKAFLTIGTEKEYDNSCIVMLTADKNGKTIYYVRVKPIGSKSGDYNFLKSYVIMFDKNGNVDALKGIMEIKNVWDYQEQLESFKTANDWNE